MLTTGRTSVRQRCSFRKVGFEISELEIRVTLKSCNVGFVSVFVDPFEHQRLIFTQLFSRLIERNVLRLDLTTERCRDSLSRRFECSFVAR
ncbi:hypothetical protein C450_12575 [Halococcus salifodinae DSM 8989]|uniref:Uncharacterized protein n=1 Tax=Halococcus salifodinae DSM 8989 TaxID=1227456 RepID=M0N0A9_9EURY|nr:hypothetical protein C450_12575 [Halococcus salifodinae DSM 8989]